MSLKNNDLKKFGGKVKNIVFSPHPRPKRDWVFVISFFFVGLFAAAIFNSFVFLYYEYFYEISDEVLNEGTDQPSAYKVDINQQRELDLNKEDLNKTWEFFEDKEARFDIIKNNWKTTSPLQKEALLEEKEEGNEEELEEQTEESEYEEEDETFSDEGVFEL